MDIVQLSFLCVMECIYTILQTMRQMCKYPPNKENVFCVVVWRDSFKKNNFLMES